MWVRGSGWVAALAITFVAHGSAAGRPIDRSGPAPVVGEPARSQEVTLGGGKVTEIHPGQGGSPHVRSNWVLEGANISITYGRPYLKGRTIGETVDPTEGRVWRLGADEATTLSSDRPLMIGPTLVPSGSHTLWILDTGDTWELIVNEQTGQSGTEYDPTHDLARIPMKVAQASVPAEQLTLSIGAGQLTIEWGRMLATVPLQVD